LEKQQILQMQEDSEVWQGFVHASNGSSYGYWLSEQDKLFYLGLSEEDMLERLDRIKQCQRWLYV